MELADRADEGAAITLTAASTQRAHAEERRRPLGSERRRVAELAWWCVHASTIAGREACARVAEMAILTRFSARPEFGCASWVARRREEWDADIRGSNGLTRIKVSSSNQFLIRDNPRSIRWPFTRRSGGWLTRGFYETLSPAPSSCMLRSASLRPKSQKRAGWTKKSSSVELIRPPMMTVATG